MTRINYFLYFLMFFLTLANAKAAQQHISETKDIEVTFILDNATEAEFNAHMVINNKSSLELKNWQLGFNFIRIIDSISGATIIKEIGDYYLIGGTTNNKNIAPHTSTSFNIHGKYTIRNNDDAPTGYFLMFDDSSNNKLTYINLPSKFTITTKKTTGGETEYALNDKKNNTAIEGNALVANVKTSPISIIPIPVSFTMEKGEFILKPDTTIYVLNNNKAVENTANYLISVLKPATGYALNIKSIATFTPTENGIFLMLEGGTSDIGKEGYTLKVTPQNIIIRANTETGLFYGIQSLRQLFPPQLFNPKLQSNITWKIPSVTIKDYPRFAYRGVLLDVARHFFNVDQVKKLLDLMTILKLNYFHWHLTDDEGWRIEIKKYPELTQVGAFRGYDEVLPPALGSGLKRYGGFFTQEQIKDIVNYANVRHITIIPEIDMPAHSRALIQSLPQQLIDPEDHSTYSSVRGFHDNVLSPCIPKTYEVAENILTEVAELFPGPYIHIGSDERPNGAWEKSPSCIALMKKLGFKDTHQLQNYFSKRLQEFLVTKNKSIGGWEEIIEGGKLLNQPTPLIYSWLGMNNEKTASLLGYDVVLTPYQYLYLELAYDKDTQEPGDYWGGYVDTFRVYSYTPTSQIPSSLTSKIKGVEGSLWTEYINSQEKLEYFAFPKLAALSELAWSPNTKRNWQDFSNRVGKYFLPMLDNYGVLYRLSPPGFTISNDELKANVEFPGLILKYTTDNTTPTLNSKTYTKPIKVNPTDKIIFRSFDTRGRGSKNSTTTQ